jgi:hypothetical protein
MTTMPLMSDPWDPAAPGVLRLPSGRLVRGRGLRRPLPAGDLASQGKLPDFGLYLLGSDPPEVPWESCWLLWPDFGLPADREQAARTLSEAWRRSDGERVEIACAGGRGRTGTALACLAIIDGVAASEAVAFVRANYDPGAVETPWQRRFVARFRPPP